MTAPEPPPGGWTIVEAAATLLPKLYAVAAELPPKDWWMAGGTYRKKERDELRLAFRRLMESGAYVADGVPFAKAEPELLPMMHWRAATFHLGLPGEPILLMEFSVGMQSWSGVRIRPTGGSAIAAPPGDAHDLCADAQAGEHVATGAVRGSIAIERRLERWLTDEMQRAPDTPVPKPEMQSRAVTEGLSVSARGFERAWAVAVKASGAAAWAMPGRRKSPQ